MIKAKATTNQAAAGKKAAATAPVSKNGNSNTKGNNKYHNTESNTHSNEATINR